MRQRRLKNEINVVPYIDVMLVLLVIFMVAAPLLTHAVKADLPRATSAPASMKPDTIQLGIKADGVLFWNGEAVSETAMAARMTTAAALRPPPELHIQADAATPYETLARVMASASRLGLEKIGFVSRPENVAQP